MPPYPEKSTICSLSEISTDWKAHLLVEYSKNIFACELMEGQVQDDQYKVVDDIIYYKNQIYLVLELKLKEIFRAIHETPLSRHSGYFKTYKQVRERFSWKGLKNDVLCFVRECTTFQQNKAEHTFPARLLQPLPIPKQKWDSISMDFITRLPECIPKPQTVNLGIPLCSPREDLRNEYLREVSLLILSEIGKSVTVSKNSSPTHFEKMTKC